MNEFESIISCINYMKKIYEKELRYNIIASSIIKRKTNNFSGKSEYYFDADFLKESLIKTMKKRLPFVKDIDYNRDILMIELDDKVSIDININMVVSYHILLNDEIIVRKQGDKYLYGDLECNVKEEHRKALEEKEKEFMIDINEFVKKIKR